MHQVLWFSLSCRAYNSHPERGIRHIPQLPSQSLPHVVQRGVGTSPLLPVRCSRLACLARGNWRGTVGTRCREGRGKGVPLSSAGIVGTVYPVTGVVRSHSEHQHGRQMLFRPCFRCCHWNWPGREIPVEWWKSNSRAREIGQEDIMRSAKYTLGANTRQTNFTCADTYTRRTYLRGTV